MVPDERRGVLLRHEAELLSALAPVKGPGDHKSRYQCEGRNPKHDLPFHQLFLRFTMINKAVIVASASKESIGIETKPKNSTYFSVQETP
jgi:hypothetical protein